MDVRERLVELLDDALLSVNWDGNDYPDTEKATDILIANGVTVQEWISVKDRLPTPYMSVLVCKQPLSGHQPFMTVDYITIGYGETKIWMGDIGTWKNETTHWMPLPPAPKGE